MVVSVIIPTVGRAGLESAVRSVLDQGVAAEILVVNDCGSPLDRSRLPADAFVLDTKGRQGSAAARNLGLDRATGDLIAFLDDDDEWLRGHLSDAIRVLEERPDVDIYSCRSLVLDASGRGRIEPVDLLQEGTVREHFFGQQTWYKRSRRIPTPTLVFRRRLSTHHQDVSLRRRQDTWWLLTVERDLGARLFQSDHIGVVVYVDRPRVERVRASADHLAWARRLDTIRPGSGAVQVISRGRDAARAGALKDFSGLADELRALPGGRKQLPVLALQAAAAAGIRARDVARRRRG